MKIILEKQLNRMFMKETCGICLDPFSADENYIYRISYNDGYACYNCAGETKEEIIKRIDRKIDFLKDSKEKLIKSDL